MAGLRQRSAWRLAGLVLGVAAVAGGVGGVGGCKTEPPTAHQEPAMAAPKRLSVDWVTAPAEGDVAEIVQREVARARDDGHLLLVYVGAAWCEPCQRFHQAAQKGELDAAFPGLRLLEFDLDHDRDRLHEAGYQSKMIPLFARPRGDGTASGEQTEGSVKGEHAVAHLTPRLRALLDR